MEKYSLNDKARVDLRRLLMETFPTKKKGAKEKYEALVFKAFDISKIEAIVKNLTSSANGYR
jgi:hypothetical protein